MELGKVGKGNQSLGFVCAVLISAIVLLLLLLASSLTLSFSTLDDKKYDPLKWD